MRLPALFAFFNQGEFVSNTLKSPLLILGMGMLLSCGGSENEQSIALPQESTTTNEYTANVAEAANNQNETVFQDTVIPIAVNTEPTENQRPFGLTLIPSVDPEQLRNVMPNSWHKLERL